MSSPRKPYAAPGEAWLTPRQAGHTTSGGGVAKHRYLRADLTCGECGILGSDDYATCPHHGRVIQPDHQPACMAFLPRA